MSQDFRCPIRIKEYTVIQNAKELQIGKGITFTKPKLPI